MRLEVPIEVEKEEMRNNSERCDVFFSHVSRLWEMWLFFGRNIYLNLT